LSCAKEFFEWLALKINSNTKKGTTKASHKQQLDHHPP